MGVAAFLMFWLTLLAARGTPFGRQLHRMMVELPAAAMDRVRRAHVVLAVVVAGLVFVHVVAAENDPIRMVGLAAPEAAVWLSSFEFSALVDVAVTLAAALAAMRGSGLRLPRAVPNGRSRRARRTRRASRRPPANDDEDRAGFARAG